MEQAKCNLHRMIRIEDFEIGPKRLARRSAGRSAIAAIGTVSSVVFTQWIIASLLLGSCSSSDDSVIRVYFDNEVPHCQKSAG